MYCRGLPYARKAAFADYSFVALPLAPILDACSNPGLPTLARLSGDGCPRAAHDAANLLGPDLVGWVVCVSACVCPLLAPPLDYIIPRDVLLQEQHISPWQNLAWQQVRQVAAFLRRPTDIIILVPGYIRSQ